MHPLFAYAASALATLWLVVHVFLGGREVAGPFRQSSDFPEVVRSTLWMCWHMVTACIALLALLPVLALTIQMPGLMIAAVLLGAALSIAGIAAQFALRAKFTLLPQGWLFLPVAILAALAL